MGNNWFIDYWSCATTAVPPIKWHWFEKGRSLCGRKMYHVNMTASRDGCDEDDDNCRICQKILFARSGGRKKKAG